MWIDLDYYRQKPLYLTGLQEKIAALPETERQEIRFLVIMDTRGRYRRLAFQFPKGRLLEEYRDICKRYLLAMINNMIVTFGGSSLSIYFDHSSAVLLKMCEEAAAEFDLDRNDNRRSGYGSYINYINRMNKFLGLGKFGMSMKDIASWEEPDTAMEFRLYEPRVERREVELLRRAAAEMEGKCFCSLDVGGNSIKGAVIRGTDIIITKEYQWYPAGIKTAEEMNRPQLLMIRFLSDYAGAAETGLDMKAPQILRALSSDASHETVLAAAEYLENRGCSPFRHFDAVVIGFPDIVVSNKIAGGETFKQRGMKTNPGIDYEAEFFKTSELDSLARPYAKEGAPVIVLNDTNTASYLISVEQSLAEKTIIDEQGMFVNTVGTEMGTGFISRGGTVQYIPLEDYQHVIDLGNTDYWKYPLNDIRSVNNMNTGIPGTVQKYVTQLGLFRMAISEFMEHDKTVIEELAAQNLIRYDPGADMIETVTNPVNAREKLTWFLAGRLLEEKNPVMENVFRSMGKAMGILIDQDLLLFPEIKPVRLMSGGIMADDAGFRLFREAVKKHNPAYEIIRLDENTVHHPLLKKIPPGKRNFTVAVGSAFIGNRFLLENEREAL
jgi:hypothetical protein